MPSKPSRLRRPAIVVAVLVAILVVTGLVVTSGPFLRAVVIPRIGASLGSDLTVGDIRLRPFSSLDVRTIRLTPQGGETLFAADALRIRYRLGDLLRGRLALQELSLEDPVVTVVSAPDGTSNLSGILSDSPSATDSGKSEPGSLDLRNLSIRNGTVRIRTTGADGVREAALSELQVTLDVLAPEVPGRLTVGTRFLVTAAATNSLAGEVRGEYGFVLSRKLAPQEVNGSLLAAVASAQGAWSESTGLAVELSADSTRSEIRGIRLAVTRSGRPAGDIHISGPFDPDAGEARIAWRVNGLGPEALGLAGALMGVDFGNTQLGAEGRVDVARGGSAVAAQGKVTANPFMVRTSTTSLPELSIESAFRMRSDLEAKTALIETADLTVLEAGRTVLRGALDHAMPLAWGPKAPAVRDATFTLTLDNLQLESWNGLLGPKAPSGRVAAVTRLTVEQGGARMRLQSDGTAGDLRFPPANPGSTGANLDVQMTLQVLVEDFDLVRVERLETTARHQGEVLLTSTGSARVHLGTGESGAQLNTMLELPALLGAFPVPDLALQSGTGALGIQVEQRRGATEGTIGFALTGVSGDVAGYRLKDQRADLQLAVAAQGPVVEVSRIAVNLPPTDRASNQLGGKGRLDLSIPGRISGELAATADSLDLTPWAGLLTEGKSSGSGTTQPTPPSGEPAAPVDLPVGRLTLDSRIATTYFRETVVSNWISRIEMSSNRIRLDPVTLELNGAPASLRADLQLSEPGHRYDVNAMMKSAPLRPLATSLLSETMPQLEGTLDASVDLTGVTSDPVRLRRELAGTASLSGTNLNYQIATLKSPMMQVLVQVLSSSLQRPSISEAPLQWMQAEIKAGQGVVTLTSAGTGSDAFRASARGDIRLADVTADSGLSLPVTVSLPRDGAWDDLPSFLTLKGTLGRPRPEVDALALAQTLTRLPGAAGELGARGVEKLGNVLDKALQGSSGTNTGAGSRLLRGLLGAPKSPTNAPPSPTPDPGNPPAPQP